MRAGIVGLPFFPFFKFLLSNVSTVCALVAVNASLSVSPSLCLVVSRDKEGRANISSLSHTKSDRLLTGTVCPYNKHTLSRH